MKRLSLILFLIAFVSCSGGNRKGSVDTTFGDKGRVKIDFGGNDEAYAITMSGVNFLVAGRTITNAYDFAVARLLPDGSLDTGFNGTGMATFDFAAGQDTAWSVGIQSDEKIVIGGTSDLPSATRVAIVRLNSDGKLDPTFNSTGSALLSFGTSDKLKALALQSDGKIVIGGSSNLGGPVQFLVARINNDGTLDTTFGSNGATIHSVGVIEAGIEAIAIQPDGKIVAAGYSKTTAKSDFAVARYSTDGKLDTTFNSSGVTTTDFKGGFTSAANNTDDFATSVQMLSGGQILVSGYSNNGKDEIASAQYLPSGLLDSTFGTSGKTILTFGSGSNTYDIQGRASTLASDGNLYIAGFMTSTGQPTLSLSRILGTGIVDSGFGNQGTSTIDFDAQLSQGFGVTAQSDDKIVVAGKTSNGKDLDFVLVRFN